MFLIRPLSAFSKATFSVFIAASLGSIHLAHAAGDTNPIPKIEDAWHFSVTPYAWLPGIHATANFANGAAKSADFSSNNVLSNLKTGGMIAGEARYGKWGVMVDLLSATLQKSNSTPVVLRNNSAIRIAEKATVQQTILTGVATYSLMNNSQANVDGLLGVRGVFMTTTLNLTLDGTSKSISPYQASSTLYPIVGARGRYRLGDSSWYIPVSADIGSSGGSNNMTWQGLAGIGNAITPAVDVLLAYRALYYSMKQDGVEQKSTMFGPQLSVSINF